MNEEEKATCRAESSSSASGPGAGLLGMVMGAAADGDDDAID
jgi:hypothetical protein